MVEAERGAFAVLLHGVFAYYSKTLSDGVIELYWQGLQAYGYTEIADAVNAHLADPDAGQFLPKIADLQRVLKGRKADRASVAWSKLRKAVGQVGTYDSVVFDDPVIHVVVQDMGGWIAMGSVTDKELPFKAQEFSNRYQGYLIRGLSGEDYPPVLVGVAEAYNRRNGQPVAAPLLVGDAKKARLVLERGKGTGALQVRSAAQLASKVVQMIAQPGGSGEAVCA